MFLFRVLQTKADMRGMQSQQAGRGQHGQARTTDTQEFKVIMKSKNKHTTMGNRARKEWHEDKQAAEEGQYRERHKRVWVTGKSWVLLQGRCD